MPGLYPKGANSQLLWPAFGSVFPVGNFWGGILYNTSMENTEKNVQELWEPRDSWLMRLGKHRSVLLISLLSMMFTVAVTAVAASLIDGVDLTVAVGLAVVVSGIVAPVISWIFTGQFVRLEAMEKRMRDLATYDSLTGLLTRQAFYYDAQRYMDIVAYRHDYFMFMMLDLDHFKEINDTYGHHVGDQALHSFGRFLDNFLRDSDIVGRLGGEEFGVVLVHTLPHDAMELADKLRTLLADLPVVEGDSLRLTVSIGMAFHTNETPPELDRLIHQADQALYQAKANGRNCAVLYDPMEDASNNHRSQ